ncbi:MAG: RNA polymerase subunit sigma [Clostridia bacterium]|nr:sigma factor [Lachnospiraceae bacterium]NCC00328.1 RNA polymerase subunit sigma [Clostridia bacterium]NCD02980.1 RNA polymerase subunit sigma [Clostridia bacterium]
MTNEHEIIQLILSAQKDSSAADYLINQYMPFIRSETSKFLKHPIIDGQDDDELSISMFAFYEAIMAYKKHKGSFLNLASLGIRNRLIDFYRKEKRHTGNLSLDQPADSSNEADTIADSIASPKSDVDDMVNISAANQELTKYAAELKEFGLNLSDIADNCPSQERTYQACMQVLQYAKSHPDIFDSLLQSKKLPISQLTLGSSIKKKTLERHRKYIVAILLAYTNGFEIIRSHLHQIQREGGK